MENSTNGSFELTLFSQIACCMLKERAMLKFSAKKPSFSEKTRFLFVFCTFFLYEPKEKGVGMTVAPSLPLHPLVPI